MLCLFSYFTMNRHLFGRESCLKIILHFKIMEATGLREIQKFETILYLILTNTYQNAGLTDSHVDLIGCSV